MEILNQLGGLFVESIPTVIVVFLFYLFMRWAFFTPIKQVMDERSKRMEGSRKDAELLHQRARDTEKAYQDALRAARGEIFTEQEAARRVVLDERAATIQQARSKANEEIQAAKKRIGAEVEAARADLESSSDQLAEQIVRSILEPQQQMAPRPAGDA